MSTPALNLLPWELLEKMFLVLDPISALVLGSCSTRLHRVVSQPFFFRRILTKVKFDVMYNVREEEERRMAYNEDLVKKIMAFIATTPDPEPLTRSLQDKVVEKFPARVQARWREAVIVTRQNPYSHLSTNTEGLLLLSQVNTGLVLHTVMIGLDSGKIISGPLLVALASLADQKSKVELEAYYLECSTEEQGGALAHLLACCSSWQVGTLYLAWAVGERGWAGLARQAAVGKVRVINVDDEVIVRGKKDDLRVVWESTELFWRRESTEGCWGVGSKWKIVWKSEGLEEGWGKIMEVREGLGKQEEDTEEVEEVDAGEIIKAQQDFDRYHGYSSIQDTVHLAVYGFLLLLTYLCFLS